MGQAVGPQTLDETRVYRITLAGVGANPSLAGHYTGLETLAARLWRGSSYPVSATLAAAWDTSLAGNPAALAQPVVILTVSQATIAGLTPGTYQVEIVAAPGVLDELIHQGPIRLDPAPGTTPLPRTYADFADIVDECGWIERIENLADSRAAGFVPELGQASRVMERWAMARVNRSLSGQSALHSPVASVAPYSPTSGIDAGSAWGDSTIPDATLQAAAATYSTLIATNGLVTNYADDFAGLRRLTALYALYLILDDQHGNGPNDTPYQVLAARYWKRAIRAAYGVTFRVYDPVNLVTYEMRP